MLIGSRQRLSTLTDFPTITINDNQVSQSVTNSIGEVTDIYKLTKKVASVNGAIKRIRRLGPQTNLRLIYQGLIQPHFDYCNIVWETAG